MTFDLFCAQSRRFMKTACPRAIAEDRRYALEGMNGQPFQMRPAGSAALGGQCYGHSGEWEAAARNGARHEVEQQRPVGAAVAAGGGGEAGR